MHISVANLTELIIGIVVFCVVGMGVAALLLFSPDFSRTTEQEARFMQYQASARQFQGRMYDYKGVCSELALSEGVLCADEVAGYRVLERHSEGGYYCGDHTGFVGKIGSPPASALACNL
jgi:hypothetical protein